MEFTSDRIRAFRYWIQGYPNFYEPIVEEFFRVSGYRIVRRPALVRRPDLQRISDALFDGHKRLGADLDARAIRDHLKTRKRLQPDFLLERDGQQYLAELKSWGGYTASGQFDLSLARSEFIGNATQYGLFMLVDQLEGMPIDKKILVVSSRSPEHDRVLALLQDTYRTQVELLYLDEIFTTTQLAGFIERQLRYLDAAVAELKQAFRKT